MQADLGPNEKAQLRIGRSTTHKGGVQSTAEPEERKCNNPTNFNSRNGLFPVHE